MISLIGLDVFEAYESRLYVCDDDVDEDRDDERRKDVRMWEKEDVMLVKREVCILIGWLG